MRAAVTRHVVSFMLTVTAAAYVDAAPPPCRADVSRPSVALVLSGGGARGAAHVGVLRVLEDLQVPIDCIAGTSMGAVVGAFYAAGFSPDEIEAELRSINWNEVIVGGQPRRSRSFRRRQEDTRYLPLEAGIRGRRLITANSALKSTRLEYLLRTKLINTVAVSDFDHLYVPLRVVAADLVKGEEVVLSGGDLSEAVRASMSLPGVFPPMEIDGRFLVDGGALNNLPVDAALQMGADVVIAVNVGTPLMDRDQLASTLAIAYQALSLASEQRIRDQQAKATVVITPQLSGIAMLDFSKLPEAIASGETAAHEVAARLRAFAIPGLVRRRRAAPEPLRLRRVTATGTARVDERRVQAAIESREGAFLDFEQLERDIARIYEFGEFDRIKLNIVVDGEDVDLTLVPSDNAMGPVYIRTGVRLRDDMRGNSDFDLLVRVTRTSINARGAEWRTDMQAGTSRGIATEFYQPLTFEGRSFVSARLADRKDRLDVFADGRKQTEYQVDTSSAGLDLGMTFGHAAEVRVGLSFAAVDAESDIGPVAFPPLEANIGGVRGSFVVDDLDTRGLPTDGFDLNIEWFHAATQLGSDLEYQVLSGSHHRFARAGRHIFFGGVAAGTSFSSELPTYAEFTLGGLFSLSGYSVGELRGPHFAVVRAGDFYQIGELPFMLGRGIYLGSWLEAGNVWNREQIGQDWITTATLAAVADTNFGGLYFAYGIASRGDSAFSLLLGQQF